MHGGTNAGPPRGNTNRLVHGRDSAAALTERAMRKAGRMGVRAMTEILAGVNSTGYKLANDGKDTRSIQDYLGHQNIRHTVRYTELSRSRFKDFWR
jgi:site-specific recombinase XerC